MVAPPYIPAVFGELASLGSSEDKLIFTNA